MNLRVMSGLVALVCGKRELESEREDGLLYKREREEREREREREKGGGRESCVKEKCRMFYTSLI